MGKTVIVTPNYLRHLGVSIREITESGIPLDRSGNAIIDTENRVQIVLELVRKRPQPCSLSLWRIDHG